MSDIKYEGRLLFLKEFTKELIINSKPLFQEKQEIEDEKKFEFIPGHEASAIPHLRRRIIPKRISAMKVKHRNMQQNEQYQPSITPSQKVVELPEPVKMLKPQRNQQYAEPKLKASKPSLPRMIPSITSQPKTVIDENLTMLPESELRYEKVPEGFDIGKLNRIVNDPKVVMIECPGPGRNVVAKVLNQITVTKIILNPEEINKVIQAFSEKARIPVIGGLFKAAVGNLILTAVTSDIIGSRFVISKISPYSF